MIKVNIKKKLKGYKGDFILDVEFQLEKGQFLSIFGKSGHGKTTLLRIIAGLETPDEGYIEFNGKIYFDSEKKINLPPQKRNVGFVFQDFALFPNMTVYENLTFANRNEKKIHEILKKLEIYELKDRYPSTLSGGQKQRVALGRAIIRNPEILLLDEPLSALDESIRLKLQDEIKKIHNEYGLTSIIVSHDKKEVFKLADRVFVLENGKIVKQGTPRDVFIEKDISGKFSFYGQVIDVRPAGIVNIATIDINDNLVEVVVGNDVKIGDSVLVGVKGFNPVVKVINP